MSIHVPIRIAAAIAGMLLLTHCAQYPATGSKDLSPMSEQQERQVGAEAHRVVLQDYPPLDNPELQSYVNEIGQRLAQHSHRRNLQWHFTVVDTPDVNAFSLPGGYVYLTRGIMAYLNSEAELAAVIGHELGHVSARHAASLPRMPTATGLGSILGSGAGDPAGVPLQALEQVWAAGYGRAPEMEADRLGAEYLAKAGYDPQAMIAVIAALKNQALFAAQGSAREGRQRRTYHRGFDAKPGDGMRLERMVSKASQSAVANPREGRNDYLQKMADVVFGDSPGYGTLRNNLLLHDKYGLAIEIPPGWQVQILARRVVATNPGADAQFELLQGAKDGKPLETLQKWVELDAGARYDSGKLGGYPAAFVAGAQQGKPVVAAAVRFGGTQYLIAGMARDRLAYERERSALRGAINSFRAITPAEKQAIRPHMVQLLSVEPGVTMAGLARKSPLGDEAEAQLRLINNLYPNGEPKSGQLLKIVQ